ncbi:MAG: hypothetical protein ABI333_26925 [bacterium]
MLREVVLLGVLVLMAGTPVSAAPKPAPAAASVSAAGGRAGRILHRPFDTVMTGQSLFLRARLRDDFVELAQLRLYYRWGASGPFLRKLMTDDGRGAFVGCVPGDRLAATGLQYYLEAVDALGRRRAGYGTPRRPAFVRTMLPPPSPTPQRVQTCPDGAGQRVAAARPTRAQLRRVAYRNRALALEARGRRLRNAGRSLVYTGLLALAAGAGFVGYGLSEGPEFLWVGVGIAGIAALLTIIGAPLWVKGAGRLRQAHRQLVNPRVFLPPAERSPGHRWWSLPGRRAETPTVIAWRFQY